MDFQFMAEAFPKTIMAIPVTLLMAVAAAGIGWFLGLGIALIRRSKAPVISQVLAVFVSFMRGVPMVILLYIAYYSVPTMLYSYGVSIGREIDVSAVPAVVYAIVALILEQAAYSSEVFRSAMGSVDEGQFEAAYSVGMTKSQALFRIIFPQALAVAIPNLGGLFVGLVKGTSLAYYVGVYEITATAQLLALPKLNYIEAYVMTTIIYEVISFIFNKVFNLMENRLKKFRGVATA
jgi:His/Glu/Gln/Arg/opine family amino acid ABC transporter permease subunit